MSRMLLNSVPPFLLLFLAGQSIPIDNGVDGEPEVECGSTTITVNFYTRETFKGHVFVKLLKFFLGNSVFFHGFFSNKRCRSDEGERRKVAGITVPFDDCGLSRSRSLNPKGIFVSTTIVITFHPHFITKIDRAYRISCFYMEANEAVTSQLNVVELTTVNITEIVQMPVCKYEILEGGPHGKQLRYGKIGQQIYHQWSCSTENISIFCMLVHSCSVDDGRGDRVNILDSKGCAIDRHVLNNIEYPDNLLAGQETHVYKYADRDSLFYHCQISLQIIENGVVYSLRNVNDLVVRIYRLTQRQLLTVRINKKCDREIAKITSSPLHQKQFLIRKDYLLLTEATFVNFIRSLSRPRIHYPKTVKSVIDFRQQGDRLTTINPRLIRKRRDIHENPSDYMTVDVRAEMKALDIIDTVWKYRKKSKGFFLIHRPLCRSVLL
ncbi:zona pellucida-like domain protein [Dictyocaulus viviparus]|uniref:Zona pellucida-like domain protein n=1 Tax=Dictyocaulus viviparus TaxID=29172 RepID=A0A0D8XI50_DICVI|nr:zona pellucida-like domain protein [Dictyocaulus viviparus]